MSVAEKTKPRKGVRRGNAAMRAVPRGVAQSAVAPATTLDRIFVHDYVLDCEIGVYTNEKGVTQRVRVSVDVEIEPSSLALDDDIGRTFDYDVIMDGVRAVAKSGHINLTETMAEEIAGYCLAHPRAHSVTVKVEKLDKAPGAVGVEIVRTRKPA
jgi:7,8-dihydroneopterin aldolase/epimerase/oxygenase